MNVALCYYLCRHFGGGTEFIMAESGAVPAGYMLVGELAKRMNTTVRTLQYYDRIGLLSPSGVSEGGRRLYTNKDLVKLHQIQSMKYLGFSLSDIQNRLILLDTPSDVANALTQQELVIRQKIDALEQALKAVKALREETLQMQTADFKKYADIIYLLQAQNESYWVIKHFDGRLLDHMQKHIDEKSGKALLSTWERLCNKTAEYQRNNLSPESAEGQAIAKEWWDMVTAFTQGDMSLLPELMKFSETTNSWGEEWKEKQELANSFLSKALKTYFANQGVNPFMEVQDEGRN